MKTAEEEKRTTLQTRHILLLTSVSDNTRVLPTVPYWPGSPARLAELASSSLCCMLTATEPQQLDGSLTEWVSDLLRWEQEPIIF